MRLGIGIRNNHSITCSVLQVGMRIAGSLSSRNPSTASTLPRRCPCYPSAFVALICPASPALHTGHRCWIGDIGSFDRSGAVGPCRFTLAAILVPSTLTLPTCRSFASIPLLREPRRVSQPPLFACAKRHPPHFVIAWMVATKPTQNRECDQMGGDQPRTTGKHGLEEYVGNQPALRPAKDLTSGSQGWAAS